MSSTTDLEKKDELQQTSSTPPLSQRGSGAAIPISLACSSSRPHTATATPTLFSVSHSLHHPPPTLSPSTPLTWSHLLRPPLIRQWVLSDVLVRQKGERPAGGFELFLDLVLVAVVSQFAETAGEEDSSWSLFKFGAFFWGAWSIWQDARQFINVSGANDLLQRCYICLLACLLIGFSANASATTINCDEDWPDLEYDEGYGEPFMLPDGCWMDPGWLRSVRGAMAYFLVARLLRVGLLVVYGFWLPRFKKAHFIRAASLTCSSCIWIVLMGVTTPVAFLIIPLLSAIIEILSQYISTPLLRLTHRARNRHGDRGPTSLLPALDLEHTVERTYLFVILILGEMVNSAKYTGSLNHAGLRPIFWRAVLAVFIAFALLWLYQEQSASRTFSSALRRHWLTSTTWQLLHFPLSAALILAAVSTKSFVTYGEAWQKRQWYFGGAMSTILTTFFLLGILHKPLDLAHSALIPRWIRLSFRLVFALLLALLPLIDNISSAATLGATALALLILLLLETVGQLGSVMDEEKARKAVEVEVDEEKGSVMQTLVESLQVDGLRGFEEVKNELHAHEMGRLSEGGEEGEGNLTTMRLASNRFAYAF